MRYVKLLFSRLPILLLALALQLSGLLFVLIRYSEYFIWFESVSIILGLLVFIHMLNRDTAAEFKLPWMFILMALPLLGAVLYLFLANPKIRRRQNRALEELEAVRAAAEAEMDAAVKFADESPYPDPATVLDDMYVTDNERCVAR